MHYNIINNRRNRSYSNSCSNISIDTHGINIIIVIVMVHNNTI